MDRTPPTMGPGASSFLHSKHPISDLMNQKVKERSVFWLMTISNVKIF